MVGDEVKKYIDSCKNEMMNTIHEKLDSAKMTDSQIDDIAEKAAEKAVSKITDKAFKEIGKGVVNKLFYITGVIVVAGYLYLQAHGYVK